MTTTKKTTNGPSMGLELIVMAGGVGIAGVISLLEVARRRIAAKVAT